MPDNRSRNFIDRRKWGKLAAEGKAPESAAIRKAFGAEIRTPDPSAGGPKIYSAVISTDSVDRYGDTVAVAGWQLDAFNKTGGPVLWSHSYVDPPVGRSPADSVRVEGSSLVAGIIFASEISPFAKMIEDMVVGKFLNTTSVGFAPKKFALVPDRGVDFLEQELLEFSIVPVPANADAVIQARAAGIDVTELERWVDAAHSLLGDETAAIPRANLMALTKALGWQERVWSLPTDDFRVELEKQQREFVVDLGTGSVTEVAPSGEQLEVQSLEVLRDQVRALTVELRELQAHQAGEIPPADFESTEEDETESVLMVEDEAQDAEAETASDGAPALAVACDLSEQDVRELAREAVATRYVSLFERVDRLQATPKGQ